MKTTILVLIVSIFTLSGKSQEKDNTISPEEFAQGWELLFDGATLNGWKAYNGNVPKIWSVSENSIYCNGAKGDDIMTVEKYNDFDLKFEWKIPENGNSGVIYRAREGKQWGKPYKTGAEYQVYGEKEKFDKNSVGALYDVYPPSPDKKLNPSMEWNSGRIRVSKGLITHWVNGIIVLQCQLYSNDWNKKVAESKWKDNQFYMKSPFGHIDLQNHGSKVWYKNIKILRL